MRNNILGGLVIFMVVLTCLLMIDDISNAQKKSPSPETTELEPLEHHTDLAIIEAKK